MGNKISIHFGEDKTKSLLFASKRTAKNVRQLHIRYQHKNVKRHSQVTHLKCVLVNSISGEQIALNVLNEINGTSKSLHRKYRYLTKELRRRVCSVLIQPSFDNGCPPWHPNLNEKDEKENTNNIK